MAFLLWWYTNDAMIATREDQPKPHKPLQIRLVSIIIVTKSRETAINGVPPTSAYLHKRLNNSNRCCQGTHSYSSTTMRVFRRGRRFFSSFDSLQSLPTNTVTIPAAKREKAESLLNCHVWGNILPVVLLVERVGILVVQLYKELDPGAMQYYYR